MALVIGIDPGVKNGIAIFVDGKLIKLDTFTVIGLINWLPKQCTENTVIVLEDSRETSFMFSGKHLGRSEALKIARNVGMVDQVCRLVEELCTIYPVKILIKASPIKKGAKVEDYRAFNAKTGWTKKSNQHNRDAGIVAFKYRNGVSK